MLHPLSVCPYSWPSSTALSLSPGRMFCQGVDSRARGRAAARDLPDRPKPKPKQPTPAAFTMEDMLSDDDTDVMEQKPEVWQVVVCPGSWGGGGGSRLEHVCITCCVCSSCG